MSDIDRIKLRDIAWNFIANNDESAKYISDGEIDMGSEFLADFFEHAEARRMEFDTQEKQYNSSVVIPSTFKCDNCGTVRSKDGCVICGCE